MNEHLFDLIFAIVGAGVVGPLAFLAGASRCQHPERRCIHGDEIIAAGGHRSRCLYCGKTLRELPLVCTDSGMVHTSRQHLRHIDQLERELGLR